MIEKIYTLAILCIIGTTFLNAEDVGRWSLNDSSTSTSASDSINGFNAVKEGNVLFEKAGALSTTGNSAEFDGNSILEVPYNSTLNPDGSFSISAWVKPTGGTGATRSFVSSRAFDKHGFIVRIASNNKFRFYVGDGTWRYVEGPSANLNKWYHVLATFKSDLVNEGVHSGKARIYVNGRLYQSKTLTYRPNVSTVRPFRIGGGGDKDQNVATQYNFSGNIDEVEISTTVKTPLDLVGSFTTGKATRRRYTSVEGWDLNTFVKTDDYPDNPAVEELMTGFNTPSSTADKYGAVIEGYFTAPSTGAYTFKFAADDYADLYISSDKNPLNLTKVASIIGWTPYQDFTKYGSQTAAPINLTQGQTILIRGLYKEWWGGDHMTVAYQIGEGALEIIGGENLKPVLYDVADLKPILASNISISQQMLTDAAGNIGTGVGQYSQASISNLQVDLANAEAVNDNPESTGREIYFVNEFLVNKMKNFGLQIPNKLYGEIFGTFPSWSPDREFDKAFDERLDTFVDTLLKSGHTGIDLGAGNEVAVTRIRFYPRKKYTYRLVGCKFQGSNDFNNWTDIHTISEAPAQQWVDLDLSSNTNAYRYYRFYAPSGNTNVTEVEFYGFYTPELKLVLNKKQPFVYSGLPEKVSVDYLRAQHADLYPQFITYTITTLPSHGSLKLDGADLVVGGTFTQKDLLDGKVTFTDDQTRTNDSFKFTVADTLGGSIAEATFLMGIDSDGDGLDDSEETQIGTNYDLVDTDGDGLSDFYEHEYGSDPLTNTLDPELETLGAEKGLLAKYFYNKRYSNIPETDELVISEAKIVPNVDFGNDYWGAAAGSSERENVVAEFEGYIHIPVDGEYTIETISDDGSKVWIDDAVVVDNDGLQSATLVGSTLTLTAGLKRFKMKYFQAGGRHSCLLYWQAPGIAKQIISPEFFYYKTSDFNDAVARSDYDNDGLINSEEEELGTDPLNADVDNDGLNDFAEVREFNTDPYDSDSDDDGFNDFEEARIYFTNPNAADFGQRVKISSRKGPEFTSTVGEWITDKNSILYSNGIRGDVSYYFDVEESGTYIIDFKLLNGMASPIRDGYHLNLFCNNSFVSSRKTYIQEGQERVLTFMLSLHKGENTVRLNWDNVRKNHKLAIKEVELYQYEGSDTDGNGVADWLQFRLDKMCTINEITSSKISPACIEGKAKYLNQLVISSGNIARSGYNKWYTNVDLNRGQQTDFTATWQNGQKTQTKSITWEETNLFTTDILKVRVGDSLLLNAHPEGEVEGSAILSGAVTGNVQPGNPVEYKFEQSGTYEIAATYNKDGQEQTGSLTVTVLAAPDVTERPAMWMYRSRDWAWSGLSEGAFIEADEMYLVQNGSHNQFKIGRFEIYEDLVITARTESGGPIINTVDTHAFWVRDVVEGHLIVTKSFLDGSKQAEDTIFSANLPPDVTVKYSIFVSGVWLLDGSLEQELTYQDFSKTGTFLMESIKDAGRAGGRCHRLKVYQGNSFLGDR